jgi:hypothetical protein
MLNGIIKLIAVSAISGALLYLCWTLLGPKLNLPELTLIDCCVLWIACRLIVFNGGADTYKNDHDKDESYKRLEEVLRKLRNKKR